MPGNLFFSRHNVVRKYWWESPHHVIASACLRSLTQDVGRGPLQQRACHQVLAYVFTFFGDFHVRLVSRIEAIHCPDVPGEKMLFTDSAPPLDFY